MLMLGLRPKPKSTNQAPAPNSMMNRRKTTVRLGSRMESLLSLLLLGSGESVPHRHVPPQGCTSVASVPAGMCAALVEATCGTRNYGRYQTQYRRPRYRCQFRRYVPKPLVIGIAGMLEYVVTAVPPVL